MKDGKVYKFYDTKDNKGCDPNIKQVGDNDQPYLPDVDLSDITSDGRIKCLSYRYLQSVEQPKLQHFAGIVQTLHKMHEKGIVHCDVRKANLIFGRDGKGWIIDFDLARKEGEWYPLDYNHESIPERHENARKGLPACIEHDRFSLAVIMEEAKMPKYIIDKVRSMSVHLDELTS